MKKSFIYIQIIAVGLLTLLASCGDDFLDRKPESDITPTSYLTDEEHLAAFTINRYSVLPSHGSWSFGTFGIDKHTDNMAAMHYDNKYVPGEWRVPQSGGDWNFHHIYRLNYFLETVVPRWKSGEISGSEENIKHYIGEAYFLRAYVYFNKLQNLGDFPIVRKTYPDEMEVLTNISKRSPRSDVARFIIADLDSAAMLMQVNSIDGNKNRLSKGCASLLKSRVALFEATWLKYFKNTPYVPLGPDWPGAEKDYNKDWNYPSGGIDNEISWLLDQAMTSAKAVADNYRLTVNNGVLKQDIADADNEYFDMFSAEDMSSYSEVLLWKDYDKGLGITHNVPVYAQKGNNGIGLTRGFVDNFLMANGLPIYASGSGYKGDDIISDVRNDRDGRLWLFLKEPGQKNILIPSTVGTHGTPIETVPDITFVDSEKGYGTGYSIRKGLTYDAKHTANGGGYTGSIVYRATEAYLNYIEACFEKNGSLDASATNYWKAIRARAKTDVDFSKTIAATNLTEEAKNDWGVYSAGNMVDVTLYNIRRERRCELMAEGLRFMDLKRWRAMDQLINQPYHIEGFKLWGPIKDWYEDGYLKPGNNVSSPDRSLYFRPYERTGQELVYEGYRWNMAHYLNPIAFAHFLITSKDNEVSTSPIYQNPNWPTAPNLPPTNF
ncbi:RagB/SusD family nutrient uptake outer membrane protein [Puteibacter caeruleilacunae]|nr:RagB/SusD family nutrient uptake outer membrane protein [Puteibacter caeruleilacunae]